MVGGHHRLNRHEFEQAPGVGDGRGGLACCSPWGHKELDTTERLNDNNEKVQIQEAERVKHMFHRNRLPSPKGAFKRDGDEGQGQSLRHKETTSASQISEEDSDLPLFVLFQISRA